MVQDLEKKRQRQRDRRIERKHPGLNQMAKILGLQVYPVDQPTVLRGVHQKCNRCGYEWGSRVEKPKECPRCKAYFRYDKN